MLAAFTAIESSALAAQNSRMTRDGIWYPMYLRMKQYRLAVQGRFPLNSALLDSLPAITPAPGHTVQSTLERFVRQEWLPAQARRGGVAG